MSKFAVAPIVLILVLGALLGGCGSDDGTAGTDNDGAGSDGGAAESSAPSSDSASGDEGNDGTIAKTKFVKQANRLCVTEQKKMQSDYQAELKRFTQNGNGGEAKSVLEDVVTETIVPGFEAEIAGIEELGAPSGEEAGVEAVTDALQQVVDEARSDPGDFLQSAGAAYERAQKAAADFGLPACGTPNKPPEAS